MVAFLFGLGVEVVSGADVLSRVVVFSVVVELRGAGDAV